MGLEVRFRCRSSYITSILLWVSASSRRRDRLRSTPMPTGQRRRDTVFPNGLLDLRLAGASPPPGETA